MHTRAWISTSLFLLRIVATATWCFRSSICACSAAKTFSRSRESLESLSSCASCDFPSCISTSACSPKARERLMPFPSDIIMVLLSSASVRTLIMLSSARYCSRSAGPTARRRRCIARVRLTASMPLVVIMDRSMCMLLWILRANAVSNNEICSKTLRQVRVIINQSHRELRCASSIPRSYT